jgi:DNA repair protein RecO (recombination protein O)
MSQTFHSTEGVILRAIPFRDYDQILSIFTADVGLLKVLYKGKKSKKGGTGICAPLTKVEVVYREKRGEIFSCHEMNPLHSFPSLRKELMFLEVACDLLQVILASQLVGKAAPQLYDLLCFYLKKIPQTPHPWILAASFRLKLLKHDGLVAFPLICRECGQSLQNKAFIRHSESWCADHQLGGQSWESSELQLFYRLATSQSYQEICSSPFSLELQHKIITFFEACVLN